MEVNSVKNMSFGSVIAVSGRLSSMKKFEDAMRNQAEYRHGNIMKKDVTSHYLYAPKTGLMAQSAQRGDSVEIFITGKDLQKVKEKADGWDTIDGILSQLSSFIRVDKVSPESAVQKIVKS